MPSLRLQPQALLPPSAALQSGQVLLQEERYVEARELMQAALDVCGKR